MKALKHNSVSKVRQGVLTGILMLTGSAAAFGAAPESPYIDWIETAEQHGKNGGPVEIDLGWSRYDFEDAYSVQYRLDGKPVMSRVVNPGQTSGNITLSIEDEGDFDLTIALCNVDGCTETAPMTISISDEDGVAVLTEEVPAGSQTTTVADSYDYVSEATMMPVLSGMNQQNVLLNGLASELGKAALSGIVRAGADAGFLKVLKFLGLGDMDIGSQVSELQSSVSAMKTKIADLTADIEALQDEVSWEGFLNQHKDARSAANKIIGAYDDVVGWLSEGIMPDREAWTGARAKLVEQLEDLAGTKTGNGGGVVDDHDGAVYKLMNAIPQRVASVESYWPIIEEYRDFYRMAISLGFLTLDLIEDEFDGTGTTRVMADNALAAGQAAVFNMYSYGIAPQTPVSGVTLLDFVQLRGSTTGYASREYADLEASASVVVAGSDLRSAIASMASNYRPEHHEGLTLEQFLNRSQVPTTYVLDNRGSGHYSTGWEFNLKPGGGGGTKFWWELRPLIGKVRDNQWVESYARFCPSGAHPCQGDTDWFYGSKDQAKAQTVSRMNTIKSAGGYTLNGGQFANSHHGTVDLTDRLNHAGRAAELGEDLVRLAAFGDGAAMLQAGMLPDGYGVSECIGLPEEHVYLMEVENYHLRWQPNGNLTLRDVDDNVLWKSDTGGKGKNLCFFAYGNLQIDNNIKLNFSTDTSDWDLGGYGGRVMKLQQDGALQIVNELEDVVWQVGPFE